MLQPGLGPGSPGAVVLAPNGGNVGIGLSNPTARLHLAGSGGNMIQYSLVTNGGTLLTLVSGTGFSTSAGATIGVDATVDSSAFPSVREGINQRGE